MFDLETLKRLERNSFWIIVFELLTAIGIMLFYPQLKQYILFIDILLKLLVYLIIPIDLATYFYIKYKIRKAERRENNGE